jgi:predicted nucleic-acid-binding protein
MYMNTTTNMTAEVKTLWNRTAIELKMARAGKLAWATYFATKRELDDLMKAEMRAAHPGVAEKVAARRAARNADRKF